MSLKDLPVELKIYLLSYGISSTILGLSDKEIIEKIEEYDPSFDYYRWLTDVNLKRSYLNIAKNSKINKLYDIIMEYSTKTNYIKIIGNNIFIHFMVSIPARKDNRINLVEEILKDYSIEYKYTINKNDVLFTLYNKNNFLRDLYFVWIYRSKDEIKRISPDLYPEIEIWLGEMKEIIYNKSLKLTLSDQLRYYYNN